MFVEISVVAGPSREALGPRYKTQPLSGRELKFAYTVSVVCLHAYVYIRMLFYVLMFASNGRWLQLTLVPSALVSAGSSSSSAGDLSDAALRFAVKEKCTFSEDIVVAELTAPLDPALFLHPTAPTATVTASTGSKVAINLSTSTGGASLVGSIENAIL